MKSRFPSFELPDADLVADASVLINFLGTGVAEALITTLGRPLVMVEEAMAEIVRHPFPDADLAATLKILRKRDLLRIAPLNGQGRTIFYELIADDLTGGLDDGEAATIALAIEHGSGAVVVLDERKASRIHTERWPGRPCASTVLLLAQPALREALGADGFAEACCCALRYARMQVPREAIGWMVDAIGKERAQDFKVLSGGLAVK